MMMKIAIIGSRNYTNKTQIKNFMFRLKMEHKDIEIVSSTQNNEFFIYFFTIF